jgi:hypothetical protein
MLEAKITWADAGDVSVIKYEFVDGSRSHIYLVYLKLCLSTALLIIMHVTAIAQTIDNKGAPGDNQLKELGLYHEYVPKLANDLRECEQKLADTHVTQEAYNNYISAFYRQATDFRNQRLKLYEWQLFASNGVLIVVLIMSIGGFIITALQIYQLYKLNRITNDTRFEASLHHIRLTTSVTGIVVLAISFLFLVVFLQEVYRIHPAAGNAQSLPSESKE